MVLIGLIQIKVFCACRVHYPLAGIFQRAGGREALPLMPHEVGGGGTDASPSFSR
jgi:hypothetical protein